MKFNILIDTPPDEFGCVPVKTDFRQVLEFFRIVVDPDKSEEQKANEIMQVFFDKLPVCDGEKLWEFIEYYLYMGEADKKESASEKVFDWDADAGRVYAAFWQAYGIDLQKEHMHWWSFKTLFDALPSGSRLMEVIEIRAKKMPQGKDRESARARYNLLKLKSKFAVE